MSGASDCSGRQQLWLVARLGFLVDADDDFQTRLGREPDEVNWKVLYIIWKWRTHQAHETPTNYPGDPFERLGHNVPKDALPVQRKSLT